MIVFIPHTLSIHSPVYFDICLDSIKIITYTRHWELDKPVTTFCICLHWNVWICSRINTITKQDSKNPWVYSNCSHFAQFKCFRLNPSSQHYQESRNPALIQYHATFNPGVSHRKLYGAESRPFLLSLSNPIHDMHRPISFNIWVRTGRRDENVVK